jgi:hypothetical protein
VLFAYGVRGLGDVGGSGWLHGLKVAAVAVVAQAVLGMMRSLAPDRERATFAIAARPAPSRRGDQGVRPAPAAVYRAEDGVVSN